MSKQRLNITVDLDTYMLTKIKNINVSESVNTFLKQLLETETQEDEQELENNINKIEREILELQEQKTKYIAQLVSIQETRRSEKKDQLNTMINAYDTAVANNKVRE